jgi:hypothetical protein
MNVSPGQTTLAKSVFSTCTSVTWYGRRLLFPELTTPGRQLPTSHYTLGLDAVSGSFTSGAVTVNC